MPEQIYIISYRMAVRAFLEHNSGRIASAILSCGEGGGPWGGSIFAITASFVFLGVLVEHSGMYVIMAAGGFIAALSDDALQVRTNTMLQNMFPSEQRATLISIESFTFSMIMIVLSPVDGCIITVNAYSYTIITAHRRE